jgi:hypothetical protein
LDIRHGSRKLLDFVGQVSNLSLGFRANTIPASNDSLETCPTLRSCQNVSEKEKLNHCDNHHLHGKYVLLFQAWFKKPFIRRTGFQPVIGDFPQISYLCEKTGWKPVLLLKHALFQTVGLAWNPYSRMINKTYGGKGLELHPSFVANLCDWELNAPFARQKR